MGTDTKEQTTEEEPKQQVTKEEVEQPNESETIQKKGRFKRYPARKFPLYLRIIVVLILLVISVLLGLVVGYAFFGDGTVTDALKIDTYRHIFDIINKE